MRRLLEPLSRSADILGRMHVGRREALSLISGASAAIAGLHDAHAESLLPLGITPTPPGERQVGVSYQMWHFDTHWSSDPPPSRPWGVPLLGFYRSDDTAVIKKHAEWISDANIDFINIDWSNDLGVDPIRHEGPWQKQKLESSTYKLFEVYTTLRKKPKISIMLGDHQAFDPDHSFSALQNKADQVYDRFVADPRYGPLLQTYLGKPLLIVFLGVRVSPVPPRWNDPRFTVRYMCAHISEHGPAFHSGLVSTSGYWSWEERNMPTFTIYDGYPEAMTVVASWRKGVSRDSPGRDGGRTFLANWKEAREVGPRFVMVGTFNDWWVVEQISASISKDIEPSQQFGFQYLDIVKQQSALFKQGH